MAFNHRLVNFLFAGPLHYLRSILAAAAVFTLITAAAPGRAVGDTGSNARLATFSGRVVFEGGDGSDPGTTFVVLEPADKSSAPKAQPEVHVVEMKDKEFKPQFIGIRLNDAVSFPNRDSFNHNVFSRWGQDSFDLGSYPMGAARSYTFKEPGVYRIYCNVHSSMAAFVMVSAGPWLALSGTGGEFTILAVPPGTYQLHAWNLRGSKEQELKVGPGDTLQMTISLKKSGTTAMEHMNKFGEPYPEEDEDEVY